MQCIDCDVKTKVVDTIPDESNGIVFRRRRCNRCGRVFHTVEDLVPEYLEMSFKEASSRKWESGHQKKSKS